MGDGAAEAGTDEGAGVDLDGAGVFGAAEGAGVLGAAEGAGVLGAAEGAGVLGAAEGAGVGDGEGASVDAHLKSPSKKDPACEQDTHLEAPFVGHAVPLAPSPPSHAHCLSAPHTALDVAVPATFTTLPRASQSVRLEHSWLSQKNSSKQDVTAQPES